MAHVQPPCLCESPLQCQDASTGQCGSPKTSSGAICWDTSGTDCSCAAYSVLSSNDGETKYNAGAEFDCTDESYTLSFLQQPKSGVAGQALGVQPQLILKDSVGNAVRVDEHYIQNKAFVETVILKADNNKCLCELSQPCQHQAYGVNVCYNTQTAHGRTFCPAGTKRCVKPAQDPLLFSKAAGTSSCHCGGNNPCLNNQDSTCTPKIDYYVTATEMNPDVSAKCQATSNWDPTNFRGISGQRTFTSITDWCETHCHSQLGAAFYNCPSSHCSCKSNIQGSDYSCPEGANHDGSCFCKASATECGKVPTSGYNAYTTQRRLNHYYDSAPQPVYTAHFTYSDLAVDKEGTGYSLRTCLKHSHPSQRKRVCIDSQKFTVRSQTPEYECKATAAYKNVAPEDPVFKNMNKWCAINCDAGFCPPTHCECINATPGDCDIFDEAGVCCPSGAVDSCGICDGDGSTCLFETGVGVMAPASAYNTWLDCGLELPCKHNNDNTCLPKVMRDGTECYANDQSDAAGNHWGVGTWDIDDTHYEEVSPQFYSNQGNWGYGNNTQSYNGYYNGYWGFEGVTAENGQDAAYHNLCYCPAGTTDATTRAKWQSALRQDWLDDYGDALSKQASILTEFDLSSTYTDYSLDQIKAIAGADAVLYEGSGCAGDEYRTFTNAQHTGGKFPMCGKRYPESSNSLRYGVSSIKVMPGVKATLHKFCSPVPLAAGGCNLETFSNDITDGVTAPNYQATSGSDTETQTGEYNTPGSWKLVVHQKHGDFRDNWGAVNNGVEASMNGQAAPYSILDQLDTLKPVSDGKFMFKQVWDSDSSGTSSSSYNIWKQSSNPFTTGANQGVSGYEPLDIRHSGTYQYVTHHTRLQGQARCCFGWCWDCQSSGSFLYAQHVYWSVPYTVSHLEETFGGLHKSNSPMVVLDGVNKGGNAMSTYQYFTNFAVGTTTWAQGSTALQYGIPADIGKTAQDMKLYAWVAETSISDLKQGNNNLQSVRIVGEPDCKVTLFDTANFGGATQTYGVGSHKLSNANPSSLRLFRDPSGGSYCPTKDQILNVPFSQRWSTFDDPQCSSGCRCHTCGNSGPTCTKPMNPTTSYAGIRVNPEISNAALAALDNTYGTTAVCVEVPSAVAAQISSLNMVGTSAAKLDFTIIETGGSCLETHCDSSIVKCNLDETCRPILEYAMANCNQGVDDDCFANAGITHNPHRELTHTDSQNNALFDSVYHCVVNSKCLEHYDWAKDHSSFTEATRGRKARHLAEGTTEKLVAGSALVSGSGKLLSDTVPGLESARIADPAYEGDLVEATSSHSTIIVNVNTELDVGELVTTVKMNIVADTSNGPNTATTTTVTVTNAAPEVIESSEISASIVLKGVTKAQFNAVKVLNFRKAVAKAAFTSWTKVSIISVSSVGRRLGSVQPSRALAVTSGIIVSFVIETDSAEEGFAIQRTMASVAFTTTLSSELSATGVVEGDGDEAISFDSESIVKRDKLAPRSSKTIKADDTDLTANEGLNVIMVVAIVVLSFGVLVALCCMKSGSSKVGEVPELNERRDVARGEGKSAWEGEEDSAEVRQAQAVSATGHRRMEM